MLILPGEADQPTSGRVLGLLLKGLPCLRGGGRRIQQEASAEVVSIEIEERGLRAGQLGRTLKRLAWKPHMVAKVLLIKLVIS